MNNTNEEINRYILEARRTIYSIECNLNKLELLMKSLDKLKNKKIEENKRKWS